jgi:signal transduction histidine kinase
MLKNLLRIPDTFDPDDRRRRQVLNVLLIFFLVADLLGGLITLSWLACYSCASFSSYQHSIELLILIIPTGMFIGILLWTNRSPRVPAWLSGTIFIVSIIVLLTQVDAPAELYNGRSTTLLVFPIMLSAIIFPPSYSFLILMIICGLIQFLSPPDSRYPGNAVNYFFMLNLFVITFISWLGMSIANRAIRDARKHAESASRQAANLEAVLNSIADGVLVLDLNGKFISANPALLRMLPEEQLMEIIAKPLEKNLRWQRKLFTINTSLVPEVGSVAVFRDETRRHETDRAKDALLATASHELRTPLTAMMNYLEMIQVFIRMGKINTTEFDEYVGRAIENTHRLRQLVNNILDQAQIQAGVLELKTKMFNLPDLLEKNRQLLDVLFKQKNLSYALNIASNVPTEIHGDPDRLHQVLVNLVGNAIKFTSQGGIQVKVFLQNRDNLSIAVTDSGPGIVEEHLPDIFEAFRRSSDYVLREQQGAGLGLSITKEIVTRMGGDISVMSTLGAGSTFTVSIPIQSA